MAAKLPHFLRGAKLFIVPPPPTAAAHARNSGQWNGWRRAAWMRYGRRGVPLPWTLPPPQARAAGRNWPTRALRHKKVSARRAPHAPAQSSGTFRRPPAAPPLLRPHRPWLPRAAHNRSFFRRRCFRPRRRTGWRRGLHVPFECAHGNYALQYHDQIKLRSSREWRCLPLV